MKTRPLLLALVFGLSVAGAKADAPTPSPLPKPAAAPVSVFTLGKENPDCAEWTDACHACIRAADGSISCSTPGIACTPGVPVCQVKKPK